MGFTVSTKMENPARNEQNQSGILHQEYNS